MNLTAQQVADHVGGRLYGNAERVLQNVAGLEAAGATDLSYAEDKFVAQARRSEAGCIIVPRNEFPQQTVIVVNQPKVAFARAAALLLHKTQTDVYVHRTAVVEPDAHIGIGTHIGAGCYVGHNVRIGDHCILHPRVVLYAETMVGNNVVIHAGAVVGADGFGFVKDGDAYLKFPQVGKVIIEDDVEIGANTCIDRGSLGTTIVRKGVKLDNLIQIGHNVEIGEHTVIAAQTGISGSSAVGPNSILGGQVGIGEHARLDAGTIIGGQGGVLNGKHIRGGEVLWGTPVRPLKEFLKQQSYLSRLPDWIEEVKRKLFNSDKKVG